ncbi:unnamed protein product [Didymodactylos carnosus]|uniref:Sulfotransferase domain-containing protein n=1 Tax=Didymodactylos carnosus TaxID=1234261 RepID=A0A814K915_9BILA|nr:unnamed protein product [Didymodactylos carnosus]CAF3817949.1 unnamed protein product [Didymodactylos carnosus]
MAEVCPKVQVIDGIPVSIDYDVETFRPALNYKPRPDDIFLSVYPKSGSTWAEVILYTLMNDGEAFNNNMAEYFARTPYLEQIGKRGINNMHRPCVIKTHLPFNRIPYCEKAKYVCVVRNPKDVCVSFYYFILKLTGGEPDKASFDAFFEAFINGNVYFGDYFEHLRSTWQQKDDVNVFLTSYEEMKRDLRSVIRRLAQFLAIELNSNLLERIVTYPSFDYMKERYGRAYSAQARVALANESPTALWPINKSSLQNCEFSLIRKGVVGSWSLTMSKAQSQRLDKIFVEKTAGMHGLDKLFLPP